MKKLFLCSSFSTVAKLFANFAKVDLKGKAVCFIPTAALHEKVNFYVKSGRKALEKAGLVVDELELSTAEWTEIQTKLQNSEFIYVSGGNTFFLLQELKRTGADKLIADLIDSGKPYIGESAGAMVMAPNIEYVKGMNDCGAAPELSSFDALNCVDYYPVPHHTNFPFKKVVEKIIAEYGGILPLKPISNSQAISVEGDVVKIQEQPPR